MVDMVGHQVGRLVAVVAAIAAAALVGATPAAAHDDIESSVPADRSVIDEPISEATIDFGEEVGDGVEMFLTYEPGGGADTVEIGGETIKTSPSTARLEFPELTEQGTYFIRFIAPVPSDGHVLLGSISFTWGTVTAIDDANEDIRSSTPGSRERIDDPIDFVDIEFDLEYDEISMQLIYDVGNGEEFIELGGRTERVDDRTARISFDLLDRRGTYFVAYDGTNAINGDEIAGALSFYYGEPSGESSDGFPWLTFVPIALVVLGIGGWFTYRRMLVPVDEDEEIEALADA